MGKHTGKVIDSIDNYEIIECADCGFKHLKPLPDSETLKLFYQKQYYEEHKKQYISQDDKDIKYWEIVFSDRIRNFQYFSKGKTLLDIGCGAGIFMDYARDQGYKCTGIEPSKMASKIAQEKNLKVLNCDMDYFFENNTDLYDIIHLKNILEHIQNPTDIIKKCRNTLNQHGIIYIEVPNDYNLFQRIGVKIFNNPKTWLAIPDHINYFNFQKLKLLLESNGFKVVKRDTSFPIYFLALIGLNFTKKKEKGKIAHLIRIYFEIYLRKYKLDFLRRLIYQILSNMDLGRTVIFYAEKKI